MKEEMARTRWCPLVSRWQFPALIGAALGESELSRDYKPEIPSWARCITDDCMLWNSVDGDGYCGLNISVAMRGMLFTKRGDDVER